MARCMNLAWNMLCTVKTDGALFEERNLASWSPPQPTQSEGESFGGFVRAEEWRGHYNVDV
ncbi:MAG: hypothetical protein JWP48_5388 [Actinoallomurus sp.]|jgi:hypothetical protein|nr:hypothetical protein [Actinoallomurus sp.]